MRLAFFLLVLANLLFFAWSAGYLGGQEAGREPQRLENQLHPEKITVTPTVPAPAPASAPASQAVPAAAPVSLATAQGCRRVEGVAAKDGGAFQQSLQSAGFAVAVLPTDERNWWVNISGLPNQAAADRKAGELKALGITDFHVIQSEKGGFAVSLGVFKDEASAAQFLQTVVRRGVKSARLEARVKAPSALRLELRGPADLFAHRLPQLLVAAPGASAADCP